MCIIEQMNSFICSSMAFFCVFKKIQRKSIYFDVLHGQHIDVSSLHSIMLEVVIKYLEDICEQHLEKMVQRLNKNL